MKKHILLALLIFLSIGLRLQAQSGAVDVTFNTADGGLGNGDGADNSVLATASQADGKVLIGGGFTAYNGTLINRITRLTSGGTIDPSFSVGTGADNVVRAFIIQPDGKILVAGDFVTYNGSTANRLVRLNTDGTIDGTFTPGTAANNAIRAMALQSDGKIIIGGDFTSYNGTGRNRIARLNSNGTLDASFVIGTGANNIITDVDIQADGNIIAVGSFTTYGGISRPRIVRILTTGGLDATFMPGAGANTTVNTCSIQADGKLFIGGLFTVYGTTSINRVARLNTDGTIDATFTAGVGTGANTVVRTSVIQPDGKIVVGGDFFFYNTIAANRFMRLNTDGTLDGTFNIGVAANNQVYAVTLQSDGKFIVGGFFTSFNITGRGRVVRLNASGSVDLTFNPGTGANGLIRASVVQPDGKIIIGGDFTVYNGVSSNFIARLNSDGSLDASFTTNIGQGANGAIYAIALQSDGKIIVGGAFGLFDGVLHSRIARLNSNGSLDGTYSNTPTSGANNTIYTFALQSDGKLLVGGLFTSFNNAGNDRILRLNTDGTTDMTFSTGSRANNGVYSIAIQTDGKIVIGGFFTSYNGFAINRFARLTTAGVLDGTFSIGTAADGNVHSIAIQPDGKILLAGAFSNFNGTPASRIARLNTNGSMDAGFTSGTGANNIIYNCVLESDGKIIIGGQFTTYNGTGRNFIACLYTNGTLDASFNPGTGPAVLLNSAAVQADGKVLIGGDFTSVDGTGKNRYARLLAPVPCGMVTATTSQTNVTCFGNNNGTATVTASGGNSFTYSWAPSGGSAATASNLSPGTYTCTITNECFNSTTATFTITEPAAALAVSSNSNFSICTPASGTLTATSTGGTNPVTYVWMPGNLSGASVTVTPATTTTYTVTGTDLNGCQSTSQTTITVNASPTLTVTSSPSNGIVCNGTQATLTATGASTYSWTGGISNGVPFTPAASGSYTVTGTSVNGCTSTATASLTVIACATATVPCGNTYNRFISTVIASAVTGATSYRFRFYDNVSNALVTQYTQPTRTLVLSNVPGLFYNTTYKWTVAVNTGNGFGAESSMNCSITFGPAVATVPCGNTYTTKSAYTTAIAPGSAVNYRITFYDNITNAIVAQQVQPSNYIYFNQFPALMYNTTYKWTVAAEYNVASGGTAWGPESSNTCTITFGPAQTTVPCGNTYSRPSGYTVATAVTGAVNYRFKFYIGATLMGQRTQPSNYIYFAQVPGLVNNQSYTWTVEVEYPTTNGTAFGPPSSSTCTVTFGATLARNDVDPEQSTIRMDEYGNTINEPSNQAVINVFPNPATDQVTISSTETIYTVEVYSITGQLLGQYDAIRELNISNLNPGTYFLLIHTDSGVQRKAIIKE